MKLISTLAIGAIILVGFFDNFAQFPVVAPYARSLGAGPMAISFVVAIYSVTNLAGNLLAGYLIDWLGRKRLLVLGLALAGLAVALYAAARTPAELIAIRAFHGLAAAILAPAAFTLLGDLFPRDRRSRAMGAGGALTALAALVAPAISGLVRDRWGFEAVFLSLGALLLATAGIAGAFVAEPHRAQALDRPSPGIFRTVLARPSLVLAYLAAMALSFGLGTLVTHLPLRLSDLGYSGTQTGLAFSAFALIALLVMVGPMAWQRSSRGRLVPAGWGLILIAAALVVLPFVSELNNVLAVMALYGLGFGLIFPAANAQVADATIPRERGTAFGVFYAFYSVGVILGASVSGVSTGAEISPFHIGAAIALPAAVVVLLVRANSGIDAKKA